MLLNEFLKEHRKVEEQDGKQKNWKRRSRSSRSKLQALTAALKAQAAQVQRVSDQIRTQASAPRVVAND